jgi:hypothetical protein
MSIMLLQTGNPYRPQLPQTLSLTWEDFGFSLSAANEQAFGRVAECSVMAYLAGDCDLAPQIYDDLLEMKSVGSDETLHVCALFDGPLLTDAFFARLNAGTTVRDDVVVRWSELESSSGETLVMALRLANAYPGRRRLLFLGGHGHGWKGLLVDRNSGREYLTTPGRLQLPGPPQECDARLMACQRDGQERINRVLAAAAPPDRQQYDVLALDACYMGNLETIASLVDYADFLVVSEDLMPGGGFPYDRVLRELRSDPTRTTEEIARLLVAITASHYSSAGAAPRPVTQIAIRSVELPPLAAAFVALVQSLSAAFEDGDVFRAVRYAINMAHRFGRTGYIDLKGFVEALNARRLPGPSGEHCATFLEHWNRMVIASTVPGATGGPQGLSIYAPAPFEFDVAYISASNHFPLNLGIWAWFLASYYLVVLGEEAPEHPLLKAMQATMEDLIRRGEYRPPGAGPTK